MAMLFLIVTVFAPAARVSVPVNVFAKAAGVFLAVMIFAPAEYKYNRHRD